MKWGTGQYPQGAGTRRFVDIGHGVFACVEDTAQQRRKLEDDPSRHPSLSHGRIRDDTKIPLREA